MKLRAYNKRLEHTADVVGYDYSDGTVKLVLPDSEPKFIYKERISNVTFLESTGVMLSGEMIFEGDTITDETGDKMIVTKKPGGFYPFVFPINKKFKKVKNG